MNYQKIYDAIVNDAKTRTTPELYEIHRILPKCMGGDNSEENLVKLTLREHFLCHWLLYKIHRTREMALALHMMGTLGTRGDKRRLTSRQFEVCRKAQRQANIGRKFSEETRRKMSLSRKGRRMSAQACENMRKAQLQRAPTTAETCAKLAWL